MTEPTDDLRASLTRVIGDCFAVALSGNRMPHMSGDPRARLLPHQLRELDDCAFNAADAAIAAYRQHPDNAPPDPRELVGGGFVGLSDYDAMEARAEKAEAERDEAVGHIRSWMDWSSVLVPGRSGEHPYDRWKAARDWLAAFDKARAWQREWDEAHETAGVNCKPGEIPSVAILRATGDARLVTETASITTETTATRPDGGLQIGDTITVETTRWTQNHGDQAATIARGCVCPPTSEQTCQRWDCGRKTPSLGVGGGFGTGLPNVKAAP